MDASSIPAELDYDLYFTGRADQQLALTPAGHLTLSQLRAAGYELHGGQSDPRYASISPGLGSASSSNDLRLQAGSPAVGAASNLSTLFSADKNGTLRPPTPAAWDAGAFARKSAAR